MAEAGLVLDWLGEPRLRRVAHGKEALDTAAKEARAAKDREERRQNLPEKLQAKVEGVSYASLKAWIDGRRNPTPQNLRRLAAVLERRGGELLELADGLRREAGEE